MVNFIIDTQLPPKLAYYFSNIGYQSIHTTNYDFGHLLNDVEILDKAIVNNFIIISKDRDFLNFYQTGLIPPPKIILIKLGNVSNQKLFDYFNLNITPILRLLESNSFIVCEEKKLIAF